jgi:hypothetical protein
MPSFVSGLQVVGAFIACSPNNRWIPVRGSSGSALRQQDLEQYCLFMEKILKSIEFSRWFRESDANHYRHSIQKADS